ncbi:MAG TPA: hypothetical protein VFU31_16720, partial [Candidatus Binatia bacterium]|nr:hypothetical protein [Candidatus Binatia bacterium]
MKRRVALGVFYAVFLSYLQIAWPAEKETAKQAPATYVGNEVCKACHPAQFEKFSTTLMGKIFLYNPRDE